MRRIALAAMVAALAACATPEARVPAGAPEIRSTWTSCDDEVRDPFMAYGADALELPRLGEGFEPVAVVVCGARDLKRDDGATDLVATESRGDDIGALLAALRLPDQPLTAGACTADLPTVPWFALLDAEGRWIRPGVPGDVCGKIRIEVRDAVAALNLTPVSTRTIRQLESAEAVAAGCTQQWADMVWVTSQDREQPRAAGPNPLSNTGQIRLCVYSVPAKEQRSGKPAGEFVRGGILPPERWALIEKAVASAGPARPCALPASQFALLRRADNLSGEIYVEFDACQRIMIAQPEGPAGFAQGDDALAALLDQ